ncbi:MacS family sensor histidine kinase [Nocardiopsis sediminis]|uniref:MacS family sensor histidine kinase n=1 Tax=Nocardiopsis sediminis TaxID=1778267 RepID=A0ABV8FTY8_9ACTN
MPATATATATGTAGKAGTGTMGFEAPLWRGITVFRVASLAYAVSHVVRHHELLARPWVAWSVLAAMAVWTAVAAHAYGRPGADRRYVLMLDLVIAFGCMAATGIAVEPGYLTRAPQLTTTWFGGAVLAAAVVKGRRWGMCVALAHGVLDIAVRVALGLAVSAAVPRGIVLLLLAAYAVGTMSAYAEAAERHFARAVELEARTRERERLARSIHDSVLQVLAMVQRRGADIGGEAAELGRLAGEQEVALRGLIGLQDQELDRADASSGDPAGDTADLRPVLGARADARVTVSAPGTPVLLGAHAVREVDAAVAAALANVDRHCPEGTRVWLLIEDEPDAVTVTVRDDGPGMAPERIAEAAGQGRLGLAQSIRGRLRDLGGAAVITTAPGEGTEIELRVPR